MSVQIVENGSITSPRGYQAAGIVAGLKKSGAPDMALILSDRPATAAGAFTINRGAAAPVAQCREILAAGKPARAVVINSGNANAWTGPRGLEDAHTMAAKTAEALGVSADEVFVSSTGRIGVPMPMATILKGIDLGASALSPDGGRIAAEAIMTTDTRPKSVAVAVDIGGTTVTIGGMVKGAGMIAPMMLVQPKDQATMLAYLTTDAAVDRAFLEQCLAGSLDQSFNRITVDGDMSTNDTVIVLANGAAGNPVIGADSADAGAFAEAFNHVMSYLAREIVLDGEGVTRFVELSVTGAKDDVEARRCADAIANSLLCKTAWFGADPNWGRILDAAGYAGVDMEPSRVNLDYEGLPIVRNGMDAGTPESDQVKAISKREFCIDLDLGVGDGQFTVWTCDITYEYVKINADYHT